MIPFTRWMAAAILLVLATALSPSHAQDELPPFEDIFVTENVIRVEEPVQQTSDLQTVPLPESVEACDSGTVRFETTSLDERYVVYSGCMNPQSTNVFNIPIYLYDSQAGETQLLGNTPPYTIAAGSVWLDDEHLPLLGETRGAIGGTQRGLIIVDIADRSVVDVGSGPIRPPRRMGETPVYEWLDLSLAESNKFMAYNALTNEREVLFEVPQYPLMFDQNETRAYSNGPFMDGDPTLLALAYWPGGDHSVIHIYDLTTGESIYEYETKHADTAMYWVTDSRLFLVDTDWQAAEAMVIDVGETVETHTIDSVYRSIESIGLFFALSPDERYLLVQPDAQSIALLDLITLEQISLVQAIPEGYSLRFVWMEDSTLYAALSDGEQQVAKWYLQPNVDT